MISGRLPPHVGQEVFVTFEPSVTDFNPAAAIVFEIDVVRVTAALRHRSPTDPLCCLFSLSRLTVRQSSTAPSTKTSAANRLSGSQVAPTNRLFISAITAHAISPRGADIWQLRNDCEESEPLAYIK